MKSNTEMSEWLLDDKYNMLHDLTKSTSKIKELNCKIKQLEEDKTKLNEQIKKIDNTHINKVSNKISVEEFEIRRLKNELKIKTN